MYNLFILDYYTGAWAEVVEAIVVDSASVVVFSAASAALRVVTVVLGVAVGVSVEVEVYVAVVTEPTGLPLVSVDYLLSLFYADSVTLSLFTLIFSLALILLPLLPLLLLSTTTVLTFFS